MKKLALCGLILCTLALARGQDFIARADSLKDQGLLAPALENYGMAYMQNPSPEYAYRLATTSALLWTSVMRDTAFYFLNIALKNDSSLEALYDPSFLSLIDDSRWDEIETAQIRKYKVASGPIRNEAFARALFRMIIKDQGFMYQGNLERRKYMENGGYFSTPAIFPILAMEERNHQENEDTLQILLDTYGWPTASAVTEVAAAGAALIINHSDHATRLKYFPKLEEAFQKGEAQPLRYAKMQDRLLVEQGKEQRFGTQWHFEGSQKIPWPIEDPEYVDRRRAEIGLGPLDVYLKERFDMDWKVEQK